MFDLFTVLAMHGNSVLAFLFMSTNAGDSELAFDVVLRASNAKYGCSKQHLPFFNVFFTLCIVLSASPLLWGYSGLDLVCLKLYILANSWNSLYVYCDPLSLFLLVCQILRSLISFLWWLIHWWGFEVGRFRSILTCCNLQEQGSYD